MDTLSVNIYQQARLLVAQADREMAELASRFDESFPLSREEKEALRPSAVDAFDQWSMELAPSGASATFLMTQNAGAWSLEVVERGKSPVRIGEFQAASKGSAGRARLRAARVVTAMGDWLENAQGRKPGVEMETVLVMEANARVEFKSESRPKGQPLAPPQIEERVMQSHPVQPRWLDLLPGAQEMASETALATITAAAEKESRPQPLKIGKIFGF